MSTGAGYHLLFYWNDIQRQRQRQYDTPVLANCKVLICVCPFFARTAGPKATILAVFPTASQIAKEQRRRSGACIHRQNR